MSCEEYYYLFLKYLSSLCLSLANKLNTGCLRDGPSALSLASSLSVDCLVPVLDILLPSVDSAITNTMAFPASITSFVPAFFTDSPSAILYTFTFLTSDFVWLTSYWAFIPHTM